MFGLCLPLGYGRAFVASHEDVICVALPFVVRRFMGGAFSRSLGFLPVNRSSNTKVKSFSAKEAQRRFERSSAESGHTFFFSLDDGCGSAVGSLKRAHEKVARRPAK
jgi:hypothetical protein